MTFKIWCSEGQTIIVYYSAVKSIVYCKVWSLIWSLPHLFPGSELSAAIISDHQQSLVITTSLLHYIAWTLTWSLSHLVTSSLIFISHLSPKCKNLASHHHEHNLRWAKEEKKLLILKSHHTVSTNETKTLGALKTTLHYTTLHNRAWRYNGPPGKRSI